MHNVYSRNRSPRGNIAVSFVPTTYTITVAQTPNGTISPSTFSGFQARANQTYSVTYDADYHIDTLAMATTYTSPTYRLTIRSLSPSLPIL